MGKMTFSLKYILLKKDKERLQENDQNDERLIKQDDSLFSLEKKIKWKSVLEKNYLDDRRRICC